MTDWTDELKAELTRRWAAGESAGEIASDLPGNFSRNAVIGQVHRLGLPVRATRTHLKRRGVPRNHVDWDERKRVIMDVQAHNGTAGDAALRLGVAYDTIRKDAQRMGIPFCNRSYPPRGERKLVSLPRMPRQPRAAPEPPVAPPGLENTISLFDLRDGVTRNDGTFVPGTCKWPIGDEPPFMFCGAHSTPGKPFCRYHNAVGYVPVPAPRQIYASRR